MRSLTLTDPVSGSRMSISRLVCTCFIGRWRSPVIPRLTRWIFTTVLFVLGMPGGRGEYAILFRLALDRLGALLSRRLRGVSRLVSLGDLFPVGVLTSVVSLEGCACPPGLPACVCLTSPFPVVHSGVRGVGAFWAFQDVVQLGEMVRLLSSGSSPLR